MESYQEAVDILRTSHQRGEVAQLLGQSQQDLILIVDGVWKKEKKHEGLWRYAKLSCAKSCLEAACRLTSEEGKELGASPLHS